MKSLNLTVGEWRKGEPGDTSERCIFVCHHNKEDGLFLWDFGSQAWHGLLRDAALMICPGDKDDSCDIEKGLWVKRLEIWGITQEDMMYPAS